MCTVGVISTVACKFVAFVFVLYVPSVNFVLYSAVAPSRAGPPQHSGFKITLS